MVKQRWNALKATDKEYIKLPTKLDKRRLVPYFNKQKIYQNTRGPEFRHHLFLQSTLQNFTQNKSKSEKRVNLEKRCGFHRDIRSCNYTVVESKSTQCTVHMKKWGKEKSKENRS